MKNLTNWQAIGIAIVIGILATAVIALGMVFNLGHGTFYQSNLFHSRVFSTAVEFIGWEFFFSFVGAMVGKSKRKTLRAMWIGAIIGSLFPGFFIIVWIWLIFLLFGAIN